MLFLTIELLGYILILSIPETQPAESTTAADAWGYASVWMTVGACLAYIAGTSWTALCLGSPRHDDMTFVPQRQTTEEKV
ncbi:hypothetical protein BDW22DRAFT_1357308 [Trametopsis cervina]|nr:hypothetical protein BDW22DRAFT_1357308 [Trametopsis cervina]